MGEVIEFTSKVGKHGQVARDQNGNQIASGHVQHGKVHADMLRGPLKADDAKAIGSMLHYLGEKAKEEQNIAKKGKQKKGDDSA
jgi:hypothetical protein